MSQEEASTGTAPGPEVVRYRPTDEGTTNDVPDVLAIFMAKVPSNALPGGAGDDHGILEIWEDEDYRSVMAAYRREEETLHAMDVARQHGSFLDHLVVSKHARVLKGYHLLEAAKRLQEEDLIRFGHVLEDLRRNCVLVDVAGPEDARMKIRAAHLTRNAGLSNRDYNDVIADQLRDCQRYIDANLQELMGRSPRIKGRFRLSSNLVGGCLGVDDKRIERVINDEERYPDLADLAHLPSLDARGVIQPGRNRPGQDRGRGRKKSKERADGKANVRSQGPKAPPPGTEKKGDAASMASPAAPKPVSPGPAALGADTEVAVTPESPAVPSALVDLIGNIQSLAEVREEIRWESAKISALWLEAARKFRSLDEALAVPVYSFYATEPDAVRYLLDRESIEGEVWEPCSGDGAIVSVLQEYGMTVHPSDLRAHLGVCGRGGLDVFDLAAAENVVTNPPFRDALRIAEHLIGVTQRKVALLLRIELLGSQARRPFFDEHPPARVYRLSKRPVFLEGGDPGRKQAGRWDFAWYVWERGYTGETRLIQRPRTAPDTATDRRGDDR